MCFYRADADVLSKEEQMQIATGNNIIEQIHLARRGDLFLEPMRILEQHPNVMVREELARHCVESKTVSRMTSDASLSVQEIARHRVSALRRMGYIPEKKKA